MDSRDPMAELDPDLRALYAAERALPGALGERARARILVGVTAAIAATGGTSTSSATGARLAEGVTRKSVSLAALIAASAASAIIGAGIAVAVISARDGGAPPAARPPEPVIDAGIAAVPDAAAGRGEPTPSMDAGASEREPRAERSPPGTPLPSRDLEVPLATAPSDRPALTTDERNLIDRARAALARGNPHDALVALMQHERSFSDGEMREDRDYLLVEALMAQGKRELARERAEAYRRRYPRGSYLDVIERLFAASERGAGE